MAVVTQTRNVLLDKKKYSSSWAGNSVDFTNPPQSTFRQPVQTTTSWRTGKEVSVEEDDGLVPTSEAGAFAQYAAEYADSRPAGSFDNGHTFDTTRQSITYDWRRVSGGSWWYDGPLFLEPTNISNIWPGYHSGVFPDCQPSNLGWYQSNAISRTIPTKPLEQLAVALMELKKDGIPAMPGGTSIWNFIDVASFFRKSGEEYLNLEFGWKPFVSDIQQTMNSVINAHSILSQYQRDSGKNVRRFYVFPEVINATDSYSAATGSVSGFGGITNLARCFQNISGPWSMIRRTNQKVWFSGAFTYYLASDKTLMSRIQRYSQEANKLLGLDLTPDVLWQAAPWSWLIDWQFDVGNIINNASALAGDSLVIKYGYLMVQTSMRIDVTLRGIHQYDGNLDLGDIVTTYASQRKQRLQSTPYGFGLNPTGFTSRQKAILAALGLSKS